MLRDAPAQPDTRDAADAAQKEAAEKLEAQQFADRPEGVAEDGRPGEDAELVHADTVRVGIFTCET